MDIMEILRSLLAQTRTPGSFLRLVLAEAASDGPTQLVVTLDDVASMLGFFDPLSANQAAHLAGPLVQWRTDRMQPTLERVVDVERLAFKQRALMHFGGGIPGHQIGTAEIVSAMGNLHKELGMPEAYWQVFQWASVDVLNTLTGDMPETIWKAKGWTPISDDEVIKPGGQLNETYTEIATSISRTSIAAIANDPDNPRQYLRPIAVAFLKAHREVLVQAHAENLPQVVAGIEGSVRRITSMFPDLATDQIQETVEGGGA